MKAKNLSSVLFLSIFLCALFVFVLNLYYREEEMEEAILFEKNIKARCNDEYVYPFHSFSDTIFIVIPPYWAVEDVELSTRDEQRKLINNINIGNSVLKYIPYKTNTLYITLEDGGLERIRGNKRHKERGTVVVRDRNGRIQYKGEGNMRGRGNGSWNLDKKSYKLKLKSPTKILGLKEGEKFNLIANHDETNLRNKIAFEVAKRMKTDFPVENEYAHLFVNGEYQGLYLVTNSIEAKENSVNIKEEGFLMDHSLVYDPVDMPHVFVSNSGIQVEVKYPKNMSSEERECICSYYNEMEDAVKAVDGVCRKTGKYYTDYIDLNSFVRYYLLQEVLLNYDGGRGSLLLWKNSREDEDKIHAGPIWDMELSMFNPKQRQEAMRPDIIYVGSEYRNIPTDYKGLLPELCKHNDFMEHVSRIYGTEMIAIMNNVLNAYIDSLAYNMEQDVYTDCLRRGVRHFSYCEDVKTMKKKLRERLDFLDKIWLNKEGYCNVVVDPGWQENFIYQTSTYKIKNGHSFTLPFYSEYQYGTNYELDGIYQDTTLCNHDTIYVNRDTIFINYRWQQKRLSLTQQIGNFIKYRFQWLMW